MLATSGDLQTIIVYTAAAVAGAIILGLGRSVMGIIRTQQTKKRNDERDQQTLTEYLFDTPMDPRTRTPAKEGWTTRVNRTLDVLTKGQAHTTRLLNEVLAELRPDNNGGHNFRGIVEKNAEAAGVEVTRQGTERTRQEAERTEQAAERSRVRRRDDRMDGDPA